jgi:hypothetical protein
MNGKMIACAFSMICLSGIFVFGQQKQVVQNFFEIKNKPFEFEALITQSHFQAEQITEDVVYEQLFRLISSFEKQADKQLKEGQTRRAEFLRRYLQKKAGLTFGQSELLKGYALNFTTQLGCISNSGKLENQDEKYNVEKSNGEHTQTFLEYQNRVRQLLGDSGFDKFDKFAREEIASRITYSIDSKNRTAYFGFSMVDYDYQSNEVLGYSYTDEPSGYCETVENSVSATLTSDADGVVDSDSAEVCGGGAEVYLYFSNPQPQDRVCVDGQHQFVRSYYQMLTDASRTSYQGMCYSGKTQSLPPSEDCLTAPALPNVTSVVFQLINQGSTEIDANPNARRGRRIFPDDDVPGDTVNRQQIRVTARIAENRAGVPVYFRNFDLDDPSDDMTIDPNGNDGDDNNGAVNGNIAGQLSAVSAVTNGNGEATVNFTVTRQPGDNFAIAAGVSQNAVAGVTVSGTDLITANGTSIDINCDGTDAVCRSEMLTVWRRLHIEVDSMGESQGNFVVGNFAESARIGAFEIDVQVNTSQSLEVNRFENGRLTSGSRNLRVISNTTDTVRVRVLSGGAVSIGEGEIFQLYDDDDFNDNDGAMLDGDTGEDIPPPDMALLAANSDDVNTNVFASAYVRPVYDIVDTRDDLIFAPNVLSDAAGDIRSLFVAWDSSGTNTSNEFWSVYVLGSYQHTLEEDRDPNAGESLTLGIVDEITNVTGDLEGSGTLIFMEAHRPREFPAYNPDPTNINSMAVTVAHEIGHLFSCVHGDGGLMGTNPRTGEPVSNQLSPTMIRKVRTIMHP